MTRQRILLLVACVIGILVAGGLAWKAGVFDAPESAGAVGGPFQLVDQTGKPVDESALKGKWSAVFFGFTYCPDICPGTLQALTATADELGGKAKDLRIVFMSVDPERDSAPKVKAWLDAQGAPEGTLGLTGTPEQVAAAAKAYRVVYEKAGEGPDYLVNHSTAIYLMDPKGRFRRVLSYGMTPEQMADQIRAAMRGD
ncbi:MAG: SCO family protein [Pseudomonadota bacterium]